MLSPLRLGLSKSRRLRSGLELREISRTGRRIRDSLFSVHTRANSLGHARLGLTVSRRVSTKAVVRNRIKRCIRESFRRTQSTLDGLDLVVIAQPNAGAADTVALRESLQRHWINAR
ncbi:MAG: ribonuclease P protein component [Pseudomonadota bacterium]